MASIGVVIPTYNGEQNISELLTKLQHQTAKIDKLMVIDSGSKDNTVKIAQQFDIDLEEIANKEYGHGKTRQFAVEQVDTDVIVFLTQDAIPADENAIANLVKYLLSNNQMAAACGRQLPNENTGPLGSFARLYNYGTESFINTKADIPQKGIKTAFLSDTFSAYKRKMLLDIGGFPLDSFFGEDMYVAAKMILAGYAVGYCAEAKVYHAHDYTLKQEFIRSMDIGRFHKSEPWLIKKFGKAEGEGIKFVKAQVKYLFCSGRWYILPYAFMNNAVKYAGYKFGV